MISWLEELGMLEQYVMIRANVSLRPVALLRPDNVFSLIVWDILWVRFAVMPLQSNLGAKPSFANET
jgi:hypothetical protein